MNRAACLLTLLSLPALTAQAQKPVQAPAVAVQAGRWEGALQLPGGNLNLIVDLWNVGDAWQGVISVPAQGLKLHALAKVGVEGGRLSFTLAGIPGEPCFDGVLGPDGATASGTFAQGGAQLPLSLRRTGDSPAEARASAGARGPAALRSGERVLHFPGFNGFPLNGTVLAGGAHGYFAVMVAGSGPTDRDWSNPLIPMPSHGGRDLAVWLQAQGLGSLRYDKRFIGAKDPKLDISLDAQVGDIRAALKAARTLPEAKGKKLLLLGHSEGALLSLLAASEADAALLLALPGLSMGRLIVAQVKGQLAAAQAPTDVTASNLAYLEAALDAIRKNQELDRDATGIAPGVVSLAKGLARPESRGFVRDLLDLDPWGAAQRLPIPCAVAWGDRDVQTWKPDILPADFKGAVIEIPGANHLFKRETRAKAGLSGAEAMSTYGDSTPLADLTPLAQWLKELR
ncbi:alpha/beta hydrolase [Geothrix sp. PMB-07]|uniref:alpha/beta hydrolase n=1 Tax=Geothrix sp. PMB-07 TaxID=3068640 RepID=UPI002740D320|nr:alpha/beta fold hydrolase [Geothrix sp. PMB-07]WLT30552.1 alpha/beta fold hydrolase [Geothrix sp. PMB-07]